MPPDEFAFNFLDMHARLPKPRQSGLTMMIDWGIPLDLQKSIIASQGIYIDEAKIAATIASKLTKDVLRQKISAYTDSDIFCFPGGLFAEIAISQGKYKKYIAECNSVGFSGIELSDNFITLSPKTKHQLISTANGEMGMDVMAEVGGKEGGKAGHMEVATIIDDILNCLDAGAKMVLIEAYELFDGTIREEDITLLFDQVPAGKVMIELPVDVIKGITKSFKVEVLYWLIRKFGADINLANIEWDEIYFTEISRSRMCGDSSDNYSYADAK